MSDYYNNEVNIVMSNLYKNTKRFPTKGSYEVVMKFSMGNGGPETISDIHYMVHKKLALQEGIYYTVVSSEIDNTYVKTTRCNYVIKVYYDRNMPLEYLLKTPMKFNHGSKEYTFKMRPC